MKTDKEILFEQYKLLVETASGITHNRQSANSFYLTINSFLLGAASLIKNEQHSVLLICIIGVIASVLWFYQIQSYKNINSAKFKVIQHMEKNLPVSVFTEEETVYKQKKHIELTSIEKLVPAVFVILYLALSVSTGV